jgi:hypothetical protein
MSHTFSSTGPLPLRTHPMERAVAGLPFHNKQAYLVVLGHILQILKLLKILEKAIRKAFKAIFNIY